MNFLYVTRHTLRRARLAKTATAPTILRAAKWALLPPEEKASDVPCDVAPGMLLFGEAPGASGPAALAPFS